MHLDYANRTIPWWSDLSAKTSGILALPCYEPKASQAELIIIGGGIAGLSAAACAAELGINTILLESEISLGHGATGKNAGILSAGVNMPLAEMGADSPGLFLWKETAAICNELFVESMKPNAVLHTLKTGSLCLGTSNAAAKRLQLETKHRQAIGLRANLLSVKEAAQMTADRLCLHDVKSILHFPDEGRVQPLTLIAHMANKARSFGARLFGNSRVISCHHTSLGWELKLESGEILHAPSVIKAVGPEVKPTSRIYALSFAADLPDNFPLFWDANPYTYYDYRPGQGRLTVSGGPYGKIDGSSDQLYHMRMIKQAAGWLPELEGKTPVYKWAVNLNINAQTIPKVVRINRIKSGLSIEGLGALGVLSGIALARQAVELLKTGVFSEPKPASRQ